MFRVQSLACRVQGDQISVLVCKVQGSVCRV